MINHLIIKHIFIFCFLINYANIFCQDLSISKENRYFNHITDKILRNDKKITSDEILLKGDSLYRSSINDWQRVKALFVIIQGYEMQHNLSSSLDVSLKADSIAIKSNLIYFKPKTSGIIASLYNNLNMEAESNEYLERALQYTSKLDRENFLIDRSIIYQRISAVYSKQKKHKKALSANLLALSYLEDLKKEFPFAGYSKAYIPALLNIGVNYYNLQNYKLSKFYYEKGLKAIDDNNNFYLAYFYIRYAAAEIKLKNINSALIYINKSKTLADKMADKNLELQIDEVFDEYYTLNKEVKKADSIKKRIIDNGILVSNSKETAAKNILKKTKNEIKTEKKVSLLFIIISILLIVFTLFIGGYKNYQNKKIKIQYEKIIDDFEKVKNKEIQSVSSKVNTTSKEPLSEKKTTELLQKLEEFENSEIFTGKNFNISNMAIIFNSNTKYINYLLQNYRGKNFSDYLNNIRIRYIIKKMINNPEYLNYKIDYLAEITGYSSHSRFTQMFKKEMKISPSEFIAQQLSKKTRE
ncbi:hypothetical protein ACM39_02030 [Chryseobacterium sp. FH2]|uniref:helix-turn-helix domain-containing protein n=1 Tax=Chryseobacterium sp. FH2 TaxID=1674291 RepID=UPI00065AEE13|nr:helix-turn-helix domain-containing protein [Chryseobacterium sp. FH2]KMQ69844.1 hypothetical protein ACM39_02030 [Chryseobacterium sp. FH2]